MAHLKVTRLWETWLVKPRFEQGVLEVGVAHTETWLLCERHDAYMRDVTFYGRTDSFMTDMTPFQETWLLYERLTPLWRHDFFVRDMPPLWEIWLVYERHDSFMTDMTPLWVTCLLDGDSFVSDMTHSCATWLVHETWLLCERHDSFVSDMTHWSADECVMSRINEPWLINASRDSLTRGLTPQTPIWTLAYLRREKRTLRQDSCVRRMTHLRTRLFMRDVTHQTPICTWRTWDSRDTHLRWAFLIFFLMGTAALYRVCSTGLR